MTFREHVVSLFGMFPALGRRFCLLRLGINLQRHGGKESEDESKGFFLKAENQSKLVPVVLTSGVDLPLLGATTCPSALDL